MRSQGLALLCTAALSFMLTACQGGGTSPGTASATQVNTPTSMNASATASVLLKIAVPTLQSGSRAMQYISASTHSAQVLITNTASTTNAPTTINCTTSCSANINAPLGTNTFTVSLFDQQNAQGNLLSKGSTTTPIVAGQANTVNIAFSGAIARLALSTATSTLTLGKAAQLPLTVTAYDADGNTIIGTQNYLTPITLRDADSSTATSLTTTTLTSPATTAILTYNGGNFSTANITANLNGGSVSANTLAIAANAALSTLPVAGVPSHMKVYAVLAGSFHNQQGVMSGAQVTSAYQTIAKYVDYMETDNRATNYAHAAGIKVGFYTDPINAHGNELTWPTAAFAHDCAGNFVIPNYSNTPERLGNVNSATLVQSWNQEIQGHLQDQWGTYTQDFVRSDDSAYPGDQSQGYFTGYYGGPMEPASNPYCSYSNSSFLSGLRTLYAQAAVPVIFNGATDPSYTSYINGASNTLGGQCETCFGNWTGTVWQNHVNAEIAFVTQGKLFNSFSHGNAAPNQQLYLYASMLLGFDPRYTVLSMDIPTPSGISTTPLVNLVPLNPLSTSASVSGYLQAEGVYTRQFGSCYISQVPAGPCAVVVNSDTSTHSMPASLNTYHHTVNFSGSGIATEFGDTGTVSATGAAPPSQLSSMSATILFQ